MIFSFTEKLVLILCVAISKGQQQLSTHQQQYQQQFTHLFASSNKLKPQVSVQIQKLLKSDRIQSIPTLNTNFIQNVEQKTPRPIFQEHTRPTFPNTDNRYTDDQFDYVRDFAWTLFQVI